MKEGKFSLFSIVYNFLWKRKKLDRYRNQQRSIKIGSQWWVCVCLPVIVIVLVRVCVWISIPKWNQFKNVWHWNGLTDISIAVVEPTGFIQKSQQLMTQVHQTHAIRFSSLSLSLSQKQRHHRCPTPIRPKRTAIYRMNEKKCSFSKTRFHSYTVSKYAHFNILFFGNCLLAIFHNHNASFARQSNWIIKMLNNLTKYEYKKTVKLFLLMREKKSKKRQSLKDTWRKQKKNRPFDSIHLIASVHWMIECTALNIYLNSSIIIHLIALFHYMVAKYLDEYVFFLLSETRVQSGLMRFDESLLRHCPLYYKLEIQSILQTWPKKQNPKYEMA